jgi:DNA-binding NarL/FixJ family response regulator
MRVTLADDAAVLREWLARMLVTAGVEVAAQVSTAPELLAAIKDRRLDVAVVDIRMPPTSDRRRARRSRTDTRAGHCWISVLLLSQYVEASYALQLLEGGPARAGYLLKVACSTSSTSSARWSASPPGETVVDPALVAQLVERPREGDPLALVDRPRARGPRTDGRRRHRPRHLRTPLRRWRRVRTHLHGSSAAAQRDPRQWRPPT